MLCLWRLLPTEFNIEVKACKTIKPFWAWNLGFPKFRQSLARLLQTKFSLDLLLQVWHHGSTNWPLVQGFTTSVTSLQVAEKDQRHRRDSCVTWEGNGDVLTQTCQAYIEGKEEPVTTTYTKLNCSIGVHTAIIQFMLKSPRLKVSWNWSKLF